MASDSSDGIDYEKLANEVIDRAMASGMTRREVVSAVAGAGAAGAAVMLASDRATAQDSLVIDGIDQIGRDGDRVQTLYVEDINNYTSNETFDSVTVNNSLDAGSVSTSKVDSSNGYAWQDVESNRSAGTWYQAPADKDIIVSVIVGASSDGTTMRTQLDINTSEEDQPVDEAQNVNAEHFTKHSVNGRVPAGRLYRVRLSEDTADFGVESWFELR